MYIVISEFSTFSLIQTKYSSQDLLVCMTYLHAKPSTEVVHKERKLLITKQPRGTELVSPEVIQWETLSWKILCWV